MITLSTSTTTCKRWRETAGNLHLWSVEAIHHLPPHLDTGSSNFALHTFRGARTPRLTRSTRNTSSIPLPIRKPEHLFERWLGGNAATVFRTAWIPHNDGTNNFYTANLGKASPLSATSLSRYWFSLVRLGDEQHPVGWPGNPGQNGSSCPHLDLTVDYGWLWFISQPLLNC